MEMKCTDFSKSEPEQFLGWCETPAWHEARNVTPAEWGRSFPDKAWANAKAQGMLQASKRLKAKKWRAFRKIGGAGEG